MSTAAPTENGWSWDTVNNRLDFNYRGTRMGSVGSTGYTTASPAGNLAITGSLSVTGGIVAGTTIAATTTITAGTGLTVTTGNGTNTAGDNLVTAGNTRLGAISTFAMTEPTSALVMKAGVNPVGAVSTSSGVFVKDDGTVIQKIIAAGTVSNIET